MLNTRTFVEKILDRCIEMNFQCIGVWRLANNVFLAHIGGSGFPDRYVFFYDAQEIKFREPESMKKRAELLSRLLNKEMFTNRNDETTRAFFIGSHMAAVVRFATAIEHAALFLVKTDGSEATWLERPENIILDFVVPKTKATR